MLTLNLMLIPILGMKLFVLRPPVMKPLLRMIVPSGVTAAV